MAVFSREELKTIIEQQEGTGVSIYMPTHPLQDTPEDSIRLKNLLREAERKLVESGLRSPEARELIKPAEALLADARFWQHQGSGLAIFASPGFYKEYRLPAASPELVFVGKRFYVKPLLSLLSGAGIFYVLAVSQRRVRLLQCSSDICREVTPEGVPLDLAEAMKFDFPEKQPNFHTVGAGGQTGVVHGSGPSKGDNKDELLRYFQQINKGLRGLLANEQSPLVFAGVGFMYSLFKQTSDYRYIMPGSIARNPDDLSAFALHKEALKIVGPYFDRDRKEAIDRYCAASAKGLATNDLWTALTTAYGGRVAALFVDSSMHRWGHFYPDKLEAEIHNEEQTGDEELLDLASIYTLVRGGAVYPMPAEQVPGVPPVAALFRY